MKRHYSIIIFFFLCSFSFSQLSEKEIAYFRKYQDTLQYMANQLYKLKDDSLKIRYNKLFSEKWEEVLLNNLSFHYDFDSLRKDVGILKSPDKKFRILNWDIYLKDGNHLYFGFIQAMHPKTGKYELYELNDATYSVKNPETHGADYTKWYGMLYFKIIPCKDYYTLLGFKQTDKTSKRKIIDILSFKSNGVPVFGKDVFTNVPKKFPRRFILEYASESTVTLQHEADPSRIVFNHLEPMDANLEGQFQYYIPDGSFDYLEYKKGNWEYHADFDARNPKNRLDNVKTPRRNDKPMYTPN